MAPLTDRPLTSRPRPTPRILQFGGGNFLRGFIDWKIDRMNEAAGLDWGVVILRSVGSTAGSALNAQDGLYTVLSRGVDEGGASVSQPRIVACVRGELSCQTDWDRVLALACDPLITVVLSNTTEAGIVHDPAAQVTDAPPAAFPAKLTVLLHHRWRALGAGHGWHIIPCELTDLSGDALRRIVLQHAAEWGLEAEFASWVAEENAFFNTLVDRIVPGYPKTEIAAIEASLGYSDPCLTTAELFHFLALERREGQPAPRLPLADWDAGTIVTPDVTPYKLRKVAILNGAHTALCPLALLMGVPSVAEAVTHPVGAAFLTRVLQTEVIPFLNLPEDDLQSFAAAVQRRFANPYIRHLWHDISLNALSKVRHRNLDRMKAYAARHHRPAPLLSLSLAAWLVFYLGWFDGAAALPPRDAPEVLGRIAKLAGLEPEAMVQAFLDDTGLWGQSLATPDLVAEVLAHVVALTEAPLTWQRLAAMTAGT
jgi:tagaturonate reductase